MSAKPTIEQKLQKLKDIQDVQNVMSRYEYFHVANLKEAMIDLFARKAPGVSSGNNHTVSIGFEQVQAFMRAVGAGGDTIGSLNLHVLTTPVIEVAGDGKTAQGLWIASGAEASVTGPKPSATWTLIKIAADFIKEDGDWKIWHYHRFDIFAVPYAESWATARENSGLPVAMKLPEGTKPSAYSWVYGPGVKAENIPAPPEPYETWNESRSAARYQLFGKQAQ